MRAFAACVLPALALLLLGAHFYRAGLWPLAVVAAALVALLVVRRDWARLTVQAVLWVGALEWLRTAVAIAMRRAAMDQPYGRMLVILGAVALFTVLAALLLRRVGPSRGHPPPQP